MSYSYELQRPTDGTLIRLIDAIREIDETVEVRYQAQGESAVLVIGKKPQWGGRASLSGETYFLQELFLGDVSRSFTLEFHRGEIYGYIQGAGMRWSRAPVPFVDGITIEGPSHDREAILAAIAAELDLAPPALNSDPRPPVDATQKLLAQVTATANKVVEHTAERQRDLDRYRTQLEDEAAAKLKRRTADLVSEHQQALNALAERERELTEKLKSVDDRSNTHVRRDLQAKMANLSDSGLDGSLLARSARPFLYPIIIALFAIFLLIAQIMNEQQFLASTNAAIVAIANGGSAPGIKSIEVNNLTRDLLLTQLRIAIQTLGAGALVWYMLRVSTSRYHQISRWENELHRFRLDTERAGFLIEGELEGRNQGEHGLPELMVERFSRGLFATGHHDEGGGDDQIGSTLGHLLGRAAAVKIGTDGVSVEIDKGGLKKARKDVEKDAAE